MRSSILQIIQINNNPITTVSPSSLHGLHQLEQLLIKTGLLTVPPSISAVCTTLRSLSFMQNHITYISDGYFQNCDRLDSVNFSFNRLEYFPNISYISDTIGYFDLSYNMIGETGSLMMTSSDGNIFRVTGPLCGEITGPGEIPAQRPVTRSFDVFFHLRLNKRLSKQPRGW